MRWLVIIASLLAALVSAQAAELERSPALCGPSDAPETGIQGDVPKADQDSGRAAQGYNCGLSVVGHADFGGEESGDMAWSGHCAYVHGGDGIRVVDVSDPAHPVVIKQVSQASSSAESSVNSTSHYHEVDNPDHATFAMLSMKNAGLRIFDIRNPAAPVEVAYFNPAQKRADDGSAVLDRSRQHSHYDAATGKIWLVTESHGFYVLDLEPQVRDALGLPEPSGPLALAAAAALLFSLRRSRVR